MKNQFTITLWMAIMLVGFMVEAQEMPPAKKMHPFGYMVGEWEGSGTSYTREGPKPFTVQESISYALDSTTLLLKGKGYNTDGAVVHDAMGVLYFEPMEQSFKMHSFTMQGQNAVAWIRTGEGTSFTWGFSLPDNAQISYTATFTDSTWEEKGFYSPPGADQKYPIVDMKLTRK